MELSLSNVVKMDSGLSSDDAQTVVDIVFSEDIKLPVSEIMLRLTSKGPRVGLENFFRELKKCLDPHCKDAIVDVKDFYLVFKNLSIKYHGIDISPSNSPIKCFTSEFNKSQHDSSYSLSESELSTGSSANAEIELIRLQNECDNLSSFAKRLDENRNDLIKQLSLFEDKNSELENRCKELEECKKQHELANRFYTENNNWTSDAEVNESVMKDMESQVSQLEKELSTVRKQCSVLEEQNWELVSGKNDLEEVQRHAEELHKENEEFVRCLQRKDQEMMALKLQYEEKEAAFNEKIANIEEEYKTLLAAVQENVMHPISIESSFEEESNIGVVSLKDELGGSFPAHSESRDHSRPIRNFVFERCPARRSETKLRISRLRSRESTCLNTSIDSNSSVAEATACDVELQPIHSEMKPVHICCPLSSEREVQVAELLNLNAALAQYLNERHSSKWKVFLAIVSISLHHCIFGYLVICAIVFLLSPYIDYSSLMRAKPWFMSGSTNVLNSPPV